MRYLVTGAAGFIGSHLAEEVRAAGHELRCVDSFNDYYAPQLKALNAATLDVERLDLATCDLEPLLDGVDGVYHLAAQAGVRASWGDTFDGYLRNNLQVTQRLFGAAAERGVRVVFSSSSSVYGNAATYPTAEDGPTVPVSPYGVTKLACEGLAAAYRESFGLDVVTLRYFTVYGPRQRPDMGFTRMLAALAAGSSYGVYGDGHQARDFTYVSDAVSANVLAMAAAPSGAIYNVGGGSEVELLDAIAVAETVAVRSLRIRFEEQAPGDARRTAADTSRIRSELAWRPTVPLADGLAAQWEWYVGSNATGIGAAA
ncbi:MAG: NAD-dependent epimerase/dehydratase family protein [Gaiella sp.]